MKDLELKVSELEEQLAKTTKQFEDYEKIAEAREKYLQDQGQALVEQVNKLQAVIKTRDEELHKVQTDILSKKDAAQDAREEADKLRTVGIVQREAVQDTTVLRRRVNDLEIELEQNNRIKNVHS